MVVGGLVTLLSFLGCCGAWAESTCLLCIVRTTMVHPQSTCHSLFSCCCCCHSTHSSCSSSSERRSLRPSCWECTKRSWTPASSVPCSNRCATLTTTQTCHTWRKTTARDSSPKRGTSCRRRYVISCKNQVSTPTVTTILSFVLLRLVEVLWQRWSWGLSRQQLVQLHAHEDRKQRSTIVLLLWQKRHTTKSTELPVRSTLLLTRHERHHLLPQHKSLFSSMQP